MSDGKQKERAGGGWPGSTLWPDEVGRDCGACRAVTAPCRSTRRVGMERAEAGNTGPMPCNMDMVEGIVCQAWLMVFVGERRY